MKILLVDDELEFITTLAERLSFRGIEADCVTRPEDAVEKAGEYCYELAVLDVKMPRMGGIALKKILHKKCPGMKFIFLTGHGSEEAFKEGISEAGADYYLLKPVRFEELMDKIKKVCSQNINGGRVMNDTVLSGGLKFYGKFTASISHEIKNRMAIIYEKTGLMQDLINVFKKGDALAPSRLESIASEIQEEINLMENITKTMNQFGHSVDLLWSSAEISSILMLFTSLSKRLADIQGVKMHVDAGDASINIRTSPFLLMYLLWICYESAIKKVKKDTFNLGYTKQSRDVYIWIEVGELEEAGNAFLPEEALNLAKYLNIEITYNLDEKKIRLKIPDETGNMEPGDIIC